MRAGDWSAQRPRKSSRLTQQERTLRAISEAWLEQQMLGDARQYGWLAFHVRDSRRVLMGDTGFPDWVLAKGGRVLFIELKTERGTASAEQEKWAGQLPADSYHVWRPSHWDAGIIRRTLMGDEDGDEDNHG